MALTEKETVILTKRRNSYYQTLRTAIDQKIELDKLIMDLTEALAAIDAVLNKTGDDKTDKARLISALKV